MSDNKDMEVKDKVAEEAEKEVENTAEEASKEADKGVEIIDVDKPHTKGKRKIKGQGPYPAGNVTTASAGDSDAGSAAGDLPLGIANMIRDNIVVAGCIAVCVILFVILGISSYVGGSNTASGDASGDVVSEYSTLEVNAHPEINALMEGYYTAYASGDLATIQTLATPMSELEQSYVTFMSSYVEYYDDITVYTTAGAEDNTYIACVSHSMHFSGIETAAPSVETFYIRMNDDGSCYIDNVYSWFNLSSQENTIDTNIESAIETFQKSEDAEALFAKVEEKYKAAIDSDEALKTMMTVTIQDALANWASSSGDATVQTTDDAAETTDEAAQETTDETAQETTDETAQENTETAEETTDESAETTDETAETTEETTTDESAADTSAQGFEAGDEIYTTETVVVRSSMSKDSDRVCTAYSGTWLIVVESYSEGWTLVKYDSDGNTGYVMTSVLREQSY